VFCAVCVVGLEIVLKENDSLSSDWIVSFESDELDDESDNDKPLNADEQIFEVAVVADADADVLSVVVVIKVELDSDSIIRSFSWSIFLVKFD
jgi:hypothetical protein